MPSAPKYPPGPWIILIVISSLCGFLSNFVLLSKRFSDAQGPLWRPSSSVPLYARTIGRGPSSDSTTFHTLLERCVKSWPDDFCLVGASPWNLTLNFPPKILQWFLWLSSKVATTISMQLRAAHTAQSYHTVERPQWGLLTSPGCPSFNLFAQMPPYAENSPISNLEGRRCNFLPPRCFPLGIWNLSCWWQLRRRRGEFWLWEAWFRKKCC